MHTYSVEKLNKGKHLPESLYNEKLKTFVMGNANLISFCNNKMGDSCDFSVPMTIVFRRGRN